MRTHAKFSTARHVAAGYPAHPFRTRPRRAPVADFAFRDRFGDSFEDATHATPPQQMGA